MKSNSSRMRTISTIVTESLKMFSWFFFFFWKNFNSKMRKSSLDNKNVLQALLFKTFGLAELKSWQSYLKKFFTELTTSYSKPKFLGPV